MATDHPATPTRTEIYTDLYETLAVERHAEHAGHMIEALLRERRGGRQLVGLVDDYRRAVFYSPAGRTLVAYRFDKHGLHEAALDTLCRLLGDAASWVDAHRDDLDWIHPHFRWVLDLEDDGAWSNARQRSPGTESRTTSATDEPAASTPSGSEVSATPTPPRHSSKSPESPE